ncbi:MAG: tRNA pseudouridine synthase 1 [Watsoniomyces obsoletus]|nr:MAG: tRNA pseudouridine synthase 1 [Watsoniomyces obsoletus]
MKRKAKPDGPKPAKNEEENKDEKTDGVSPDIKENGNEAEATEDNNEIRRPKRKVAVMIGYSGTGYRGMQVNPGSKTIEGDLFAAFVAAGAISKANSTDIKKSSFVRCARTDKGVHAAGNVVSLKLIIEDADVVQKINQALSPQIRVWGIEQTVKSFSCYQMCDSRIYEYLIPSHTTLPPHPRSYLGRKIEELAKEANDLEGFKERQKDVEGFWEDVEKSRIKPILDSLDPSIREVAMAEAHGTHVTSEPLDPVGAATLISSEGFADEEKAPNVSKDLTATVRRIKSVYLDSKKNSRISPYRLDRLRKALAEYQGTHRFHNYTTSDKRPSDPSANRHIMTFTADDPILIGNTEWISLKVHGQSFMMHQIRKMVSMATLVVRTGCPLERIRETYGHARVNIPRAPGLGLLLERPVFNSYNERAVGTYQRGTIDFNKYEAEIKEFKQRMIYEQIFQEEEKENHFHAFFAHIDSENDRRYLYFSSKGLEAVEGPRGSKWKRDDQKASGKAKQRGENQGEVPNRDSPGSDVASLAEEGVEDLNEADG